MGLIWFLLCTHSTELWARSDKLISQSKIIHAPTNLSFEFSNSSEDYEVYYWLILICCFLVSLALTTISTFSGSFRLNFTHSRDSTGFHPLHSNATAPSAASYWWYLHTTPLEWRGCDAPVSLCRWAWPGLSELIKTPELSQSGLSLQARAVLHSWPGSCARYWPSPFFVFLQVLLPLSWVSVMV